MQVDTAVFEALAERVEQLARQLDDVSTAEAIIRRAQAGTPAENAPRRRADRTGAKVIPLRRSP